MAKVYNTCHIRNMKKLGKGTMREQSSAFGNKVKMSFRKEECEVKENEGPD